MKKTIYLLIVLSLMFSSNIANDRNNVYAEKNESEQETLIIGDEILTFNIATDEGLLFTVERDNNKTEFYKYNDYIYQKIDNQMIIVTKIDEQAINEQSLQSRATWSSYTAMSSVLVNVTSTSSAATVVGIIASAIGCWPSAIVSIGSIVVDSMSSPQYVYVSYSIATYSQCSILTSKTNYKVYMATYNGSSWVRGAQKGYTITNKSYYWTGDPSNYSYPVACRSLTGTYPYQYGPM